MNYKTDHVTDRAKESPLWAKLEKQNGDALPYLLERYLLLENWRYLERFNDGLRDGYQYDISFLHLLLSEAATVLLSQEERIRKLEAAAAPRHDPCRMMA